MIRSRAPTRAISKLPVKMPTGRVVGLGYEVSGRPAGFKTLQVKFSINDICSKILKKKRKIYVQNRTLTFLSNTYNN